MRYGNMLLAGDAAHTVPPTGAKGLNLALADVRILAEALKRAILKKDLAALDKYSPRALARVWKSQHFSYWMTTMLHTLPDAAPFDTRRQIGQLESVVSSKYYSRGFPVRGRATARRDALCAGRCYIASPPSRPRLVTRFRLWRGAGRCSGASGRWPGAAVAGRTSAARRRGGRGRSARRRTAGRDRRAGRSRRSTA